MCVTGAFVHPPTPLCTEAPDPPPEHYAFLYSRPHVSENGGLGFKVVSQRTHHKVRHGRGEARTPNGTGGGGWRRRANRHGEPVRRLRHAAHRAEHGHLLERHRQDSAHLSLRRVRRVPLGARVQAAARGPSGKARANGCRCGGAHEAATVRGCAALRCGVHGADQRAARGAGWPLRVVRARRGARRRGWHLHGIAR